VIVVDVNLLVYAYNQQVVQHERARAWLQVALSQDEPVAFPWAVIHGLLRLVTDARVTGSPLSLDSAMTIVDEWWSEPIVRLLEPGPRYWGIFREIGGRAGVRGAFVSDAHLAALTIEHDATLYTADRDFRRFAGLRVINPLAT
jgi:hypothetical protein